MILRLKDDKLAELGSLSLPGPAVDTGGSSISARGRAIAQARVGWRRLHARACKGCMTLQW